MRARLSHLLCLAVGLLAAAPACANKAWAIIHMEGERPNRSVYFANIFWITERTDPNEMLAAIKKVQAENLPREQASQRIEESTRRPSMQVVQILESPNGPFVRNLDLQFECLRNTVTITSNAQIYHHNGRSDDGPTGGPHPVAAPWVKQARRAACEEKTWRAALQADVDRGSGQTELTELGMVMAIKTSQFADMYEFAWDKFWKDGSKRALSSDRSAQELAQERQQADAQQREANKTIDATMAAVGVRIQNEDLERAFLNSIAATFAKKPNFERQAMDAQAGWTESDLIKFWGVPQQVSELAGARELVFRNESDERVTQNTIDMKSGQIVGSTTTGQLRQCELSLFLKPGGKAPGPRLVDYQMRGQSCNIDTLVKSRPR